MAAVDTLRYANGMFIKFDSEVGGFTMFGDAATTLLKMMGHSGSVPSAILPEDIPAAIERLETALEAAPKPSAGARSEDNEKEEPVSLRQRAYPLLQLLRNAAANNSSVLWDRASERML